MRFVDRLLVSRSGITFPKGSTREIKQAYIDFWTCLETIRVHMATDNYWSQSYTTDFAGALTLGEQLSRPGARGRLVWDGSDATLHQCAAVDYASHIGTVFRFGFPQQLHLASVTGLPLADFTWIAIAGIFEFYLLSSRKGGLLPWKIVVVCGWKLQCRFLGQTQETSKSRGSIFGASFE